MIVRIIWGAKVIKKNEWGGGIFGNFLVERNILVRYFADFINVKSTIKQHFIHKHHSRRFTIIFERK